MSKICEAQLKMFEISNFYVYGVRHHFLRHSEILALQSQQSKIPQDCLFKALSYKLNAMQYEGQLKGPR